MTDKKNAMQHGMSRKAFIRSALMTAVFAGALSDAAASDAAPSDGSKPAQYPVSKTRLILLGTAGGPIIQKFRSQPSNLLIVEGVPYLIDAGAGCVRQLALAGYQPIDLAAVFITHNHLDHNADVVNLISSNWIDGRKQPFPIYGPYGTKHMARAALDYFSVPERIFSKEAKFSIPASQFVAPHEITKPGLVYSDSRIKVYAAENTHYRTFDSGPDKSWSYRFETPGRTIVFTGDTGPSDSVTRLAKGADILVSEVIDVAGAVKIVEAHKGIGPKGVKHLAEHMAREHLSPEEVGKMAAKAGVKMVVLTHIIPSDGAQPDAAHFTAGVRRYFNGPVIEGRDLLEF